MRNWAASVAAYLINRTLPTYTRRTQEKRTQNECRTTGGEEQNTYDSHVGKMTAWAHFAKLTMLLTIGMEFPTGKDFVAFVQDFVLKESKRDRVKTRGGNNRTEVCSAALCSFSVTAYKRSASVRPSHPFARSQNSQVS